MKTFITDENVSLTLQNFLDNIVENDEEDVTWDDFHILCSLDEGESCHVGINKVTRIK